MDQLGWTKPICHCIGETIGGFCTFVPSCIAKMPLPLQLFRCIISQY